MSKKGRPTDYSPEVARRICELIANSSNGLKRICKENDDLPVASTIRRWIVEKEDFKDLYARAKEEQADFLADEIIDISDEVAELPLSQLSHERIGAARLQVDSRKWIAAKLKPKKYGDKIDHTTDNESFNKGFSDFLKETSGK